MHRKERCNIAFPPWSLRITAKDEIPERTIVALYASIKSPQAIASLAMIGLPPTADDVMVVTIVEKDVQFEFGLRERVDIAELLALLRHTSGAGTPRYRVAADDETVVG